MHAAPPTTFVCPTCGERLVVDAAVREALLEHGCVFCGAAVGPTAFDKE